MTHLRQRCGKNSSVATTLRATRVPPLRSGGLCEIRAGWDATFSAPKSVSLTALVSGDDPAVLGCVALARSAGYYPRLWRSS